MNWILCPVRNGLHLTQEAVKTFLRQDLPEVRVMLIDNASEDGTREWARTLHPRVVTVYNDPPLSVAASWNKGLSLLFDGTPNNAVLVVNNDVELRFDTYRKLLESGEDFPTGVGVNDRKQMQIYEVGEKSPHPDFSCFLMQRHVWEKVGKFDEGFKGAFYEDNDMHVRLHRAGVHACNIGIPFYHVGSATLNLMPLDEQHLLQDQAGRNREYFNKKWGFDSSGPEYDAEFLRNPSDIPCDTCGTTT
jgi:O-antigen biosynthesis protein